MTPADPYPPMNAVFADPYDALVIAKDAMAAALALEAVALAGGLVAAHVGFDGVADKPDGVSPRVMLIEVAGVDDAVLAGALPRIADRAATLGARIIVALDEAQIDIVTATMLGAGAQLLCLPSLAERIAALVLIATEPGRAGLDDSLSEGDAARLARMNAEIARIAEVLARLSRREEPGPGATEQQIADRRQTFDAGPTIDAGTIDAHEVRRTIRARRLRDQHFGTGLFEDPAWDMMLDLFAADLERAQVSVSSLCIAAAVAPTTALRWIGKLTDAGLFERHPDPFDRRRAFMALSRRATEGMRAHVAALRRAGLPLA